MAFVLHYASPARFDYDVSVNGIDILLQSYDAREAGFDARRHDVFKRAALMLLLTAWESYIEDTLRDQLSRQLEHAATPEQVKTSVTAAAKRCAKTGLASPLLPSGKYARDWRARVLASFDEERDRLNTPNSQKIRELSRYLGQDLTKHWRWRGVSPEMAGARLDDLIRTRGRLTHRGKHFLDLRHSITRQEVRRARRLIEALVDSTDAAFGISPRDVRIDE